MFGGSIASYPCFDTWHTFCGSNSARWLSTCQEGRAGKALGVSLVASTLGGIFSTLCLIFLAPQLAKIALKFGPPEYFALMIFGLTIMASVSSASLTKGFLSGFFGLLLSMVGLNPTLGTERFTFGVIRLLTGFSMMPVLIGLFAVSSGLVLFRFWLFLRLPGNTHSSVRWVEIRPGMGAMKIALLLQENGVVTDALKFRVLCRLRKSDQKLKAGEYAFSTLLTPEQVLDHLVQGRVFLHHLTIPEGSTLRSTAKIIGDKGLAPMEEVLRLAMDPSFVRSLGFQSPTLEGYLYPDTYLLPRSSTASSILKAMVQQFWNRFPEDGKGGCRTWG